MKGIIFNITEQFLSEKYGEDTLEAILNNCELQTTEPFVAPGTYPDSDLAEIVSRSSDMLRMTPAEFLKKLGHFAFFKMAERYPHFVKNYHHPKEFLKTVEHVIHVEVKKLYKETRLPAFQYAEPNENELIITYYSERKLYALMEGLIDGVADYFSMTIKQSNKIYTKDNTELCDFHLRFS